MKILVIGGAGYVGVELCHELLSQGFSVKVLDTFWFGKEVFNDVESKNLEIVVGDVRKIGTITNIFKDVETVIHLACISNDPSFELDPKLSKSVNFDSFLPVIELAKLSGVHRFIFASSSSVYGVSTDSRVTEKSSIKPLTDYSKYKYECEKICLEYADNDFIVTILRPATVCGYSRRLRLDLVVNILTASAYFDKKIVVFGGNQYRPNIHIKEMVRAYVSIMLANEKLINKKIYNVGGKNYTVYDLAKIVNQQFNFAIPIITKPTNDLRSYRVDSELIQKELNFSVKLDVSDAVNDLIEFFRTSKLSLEKDGNYFSNIQRLKELISKNEI